MSNIGNNGKAYEENWIRHQELVKEVEKLNGNLKTELASRDAAAQDMEQHRASATPEEMARLEGKVAKCDSDVEKVRTEYVAAQTAVGQLELAVGGEQAQWLSEGLPPPESLLAKLAKAELPEQVIEVGVGTVTDALNFVKDNLQMTMAGVAALATIGSHAAPMQDMYSDAMLAPNVAQSIADGSALNNPGEGKILTNPSEFGQERGKAKEKEQPETPDIDDAIPPAYKAPNKDDINKVAEDAHRANQQINRAEQNAPSREPPGSIEQVEALDKSHKEEMKKVAHEATTSRKMFEDRHERLNTDPALVNGLREKLEEGIDARQLAVTERQERERKELIEHGEKKIEIAPLTHQF